MNTQQAFKHWRKRVFLTTWITYSTFYLCRVNMSIAVPGIMGEFGYSKTAMGGVMTALLVAYAAGQFINGQLGDKFGARRLITLGILGSALLNIAFGFSPGITVMIAIWALNGYFQSMGWAPSVKTIANWFPPNIRGKMGGVPGFLSSNRQCLFLGSRRLCYRSPGLEMGFLGASDYLHYIRDSLVY